MTKAKIFQARHKKRKVESKQEQNKVLNGENGFRFRYIGMALAVLLAIAVSFGLRQWFSWRLTQSVKTPLSLAPVITEDSSPDLFWGTYRPGFYFGLKHRGPNSLLFGIIWTLQDIQQPRFRHVCNMHDGIRSYNWLEHDGRNFGIQQIVDSYHIITVSFAKQSPDVAGGDWSVRISAVALNGTHPPLPLSIIVYFYYASENQDTAFAPIVEAGKIIGLTGFTRALGEHQVYLHPTKDNLQVSSLVAVTPGEEYILETLLTGIGLRRDRNLMILTGRPRTYDASRAPNIWFHEITVDPPIRKSTTDVGQNVLEVELTRLGRTGEEFIQDQLTKRLQNLSDAFHKRFAEHFPVDNSAFTQKEANLSKIALSNLLGGLGYFYGTSLVQSSLPGSEPVENWPSGLFTATPSRSLFPRGFLWDEGFHGLLLARWDPELAMETVGHWLDLMNVDGWIPREQILGSEARSRVPDQFVVQKDTIANPPTLALVIEALMDGLPKFTSTEIARFQQWSLAALPRLNVWYRWLNRTQAGSIPSSFRWRGRDPQNPHQLNPLTLSSGLDDYPRASHPSDMERHLDLRCWMTLFARVMARLSSLVTQYIQTEHQQVNFLNVKEVRSMAMDYSLWADKLMDQTVLDNLHWSEATGRYADYGLHTDDVRLEMPVVPVKSSPNEEEEPKPIRVVDKEPTFQLVTSSVGYLSLFPLFLRILAPDSSRLPRLLDELASKLVWTEYGLRSLARNAPLYQKSNTKDDPPYWRGAIWINMNYLAVHSLRYYGAHPRTPVDIATRASQLAMNLSQNIARTVLGELERTGYLWEQYDDQTGRGQRGHPFSGWTSLVSMIVSPEPN